MPRLCRPVQANHIGWSWGPMTPMRRSSSPPGASTRTTSAPASASKAQTVGAAMYREKSSTRIPSRTGLIDRLPSPQTLPSALG